MTLLTKMLRRARHRERTRAQGLVEFALVLPVLVLSLLIVLDFGRAFMSYITLTNATRVAANYASVIPGDFTGTPNTATYNAMLDRETATLACPIQPNTAPANKYPLPTFPTGSSLGDTAVAGMTCDFELITPILSGFFGGRLEMSASSEFPIRVGAIANIGGGTTIPPPGSPVAAFDFTGVSGTIDGSGNVTGSDPVTVNVDENSQNAQTWLWDWGDGTQDTGPNPPAHVFTSATTTTYTVRLTVSNPAGSNFRERTVTVQSAPAPPPVAAFFGTPIGTPPNANGGGSGGLPITGARQLRVDFTNNSVNGTAFSWDFGDGTSPSTATNPQHQFDNLGVYSVTLSVTAPAGASPSTRTDYVTIGCVVPNFAGTSTAQATSAWTSAGFTGSIRFKKEGANGNGNPQPPNPPANIVRQSIPGGSFQQPTKQGQNYNCDYNITVEHP